MNRYKIINAAHKIDGYYNPQSCAQKEKEFIRAKNECVARLRENLNGVETISFEQLIKTRKEL